MGNLKRYNTDLYDLVSQEKMTLEDAENVAKSRKVSQGDSKQSQSVANVAVNDNVNVLQNIFLFYCANYTSIISVYTTGKGYTVDQFRYCSLVIFFPLLCLGSFSKYNSIIISSHKKT